MAKPVPSLMMRLAIAVSLLLALLAAAALAFGAALNWGGCWACGT